MATFLFDEIIYGPVHSRRLGVSLGINLMPLSEKLCSFDCIYCECGFNSKSKAKTLPTQIEVRNKLEATLSEMLEKGNPPDSITFSGNGEPTLHPTFPSIIDDTKKLREKYCPEAQITVLTNATRIHDKAVRNALLSIDNPFVKLDAGNIEMLNKINLPKRANTSNESFDIQKLIDAMLLFNGELIIQTMFLRGEYLGEKIDNTTETELKSYIDILRIVKPRKVTIYTIARNTPADELTKISKQELSEIAEKIKEVVEDVQISG